MNPANAMKKSTDRPTRDGHEARAQSTIEADEMSHYVDLVAKAFAASNRRGASYTDGALSPWG